MKIILQLDHALAMLVAQTRPSAMAMESLIAHFARKSPSLATILCVARGLEKALLRKDTTRHVSIIPHPTMLLQTSLLRKRHLQS